MSKIGIYPGAFDPVHDGHISFAQAATKQYGLDKIYLWPEPIVRHKQGVKALEHRAAMIQLAIADTDKMGMIVLEDTKQTIQETWALLSARFAGAELYILLGSDKLNRLLTWPPGDVEPHFILALSSKQTKQDLLDTVATAKKTTKRKFNYDIIANDSDNGSRAIRQSLKDGQIPDTVHPAVASYIKANSLYISGAM